MPAPIAAPMSESPSRDARLKTAFPQWPVGAVNDRCAQREGARPDGERADDGRVVVLVGVRRERDGERDRRRVGQQRLPSVPTLWHRRRQRDGNRWVGFRPRLGPYGRYLRGRHP
jgi:hypothetical protein